MRVVPGVAALLVTCGFAPSVPERILLSERFLRQRRESAAVTRPAPLARQDLTGAALEPLLVIVVPPLDLCTAAS